VNPDERPARRWAPISPLERRLEHLTDYPPRRTFRFVGSMHADTDLARRSADILRAEMGEPGGAA
jgi:hypothetical protein